MNDQPTNPNPGQSPPTDPVAYPPAQPTPTFDPTPEPTPPPQTAPVQPSAPSNPTASPEIAPNPLAGTTPPENLDSLINPAETPSVPPSSSGGASSGALTAVSAIFFGLLNWVIIPIIIVFILHNFVFQAFHVVGSSMVPTLHDTDYIIVSKIGKSISGFKHEAFVPHRYDVVVFHYPKDPSLIFVKRVIGLPGEHVVVKNGQVTIYNSANPQGLSADVSTFQRAADTTQGSVDDIVPKGSIFVLGDNRTPNGSFDSRDWGFLPSSYIVGTASIRLLPLDQFRIFSYLVPQLPAFSHLLP